MIGSDWNWIAGEVEKAQRERKEQKEARASQKREASKKDSKKTSFAGASLAARKGASFAARKGASFASKGDSSFRSESIEVKEDEVKKDKLYFEHAGLWLQHKLKNLEVHWNCEIPHETMLFLQPYFISPKYRPDIWVDITLDDFQYPVLMIEILSKENIDLTVGECERGLIHQLRVYRNYDLQIKRITGFVIPTSTTPCECLEVNMEWCSSKLKFQSTMKVCPCKMLLQRINEVADVHVAYIQQFHPNRANVSRFFLPIAAKEQFSEKAVQLPSGQSVVVSDGDYVYKLIVNTMTRELYEEKLSYYQDLKLLDCICLPKMYENSFVKSNLNFMHFKKVICPLERAGARKCLRELLTKTSEAMVNLHALGYVHLDLRLENICFRYTTADDVMVVLIDLDGLSKVDEHPEMLSNKSIMGIPPPKSTNLDNTQFDWRQLGLVAAFVANSETATHEQYHDPMFKFADSAVRDDKFIMKLMDEGNLFLFTHQHAMYLQFQAKKL